MEKIIIYTCITGGYDSLKQPLATAEGFEFICFVQKGMKNAEYDGVWKLEEIPFEWDDLQLLSRFPKMNPHSVLPEDIHWSLWMDANIRITDGSIYQLCRGFQERGVKYAGVKHPFNDCAYSEALKCLYDRRDSLGNLLKTIKFLRKNHLKEHAGLMENNLIFREHFDPAVEEFDKWWWECMVLHSHRDQLTHTFCLLDTPSLKAEYLLPEGVTARNFPGLEYTGHPKKELDWWHRKMKYGLNKPEGLILKFYTRISKLIYK